MLKTVPGGAVSSTDPWDQSEAEAVEEDAATDDDHDTGADDQGEHEHLEDRESLQVIPIENANKPGGVDEPEDVGAYTQRVAISVDLT